MSDTQKEANEKPIVAQADFERLTALVSAEFQVEESLMEQGIPTYYLKQPQETKQAFLKLLKGLEPLRFIAILRKQSGRIVLRVFSTPPTKPSKTLLNWILFFATIVTTFLTGYMLSGGLLDPLVGGAAFTISIVAVLGSHEMGHKLTADRKGIEATLPYFIPGPPPFGTFGAVIMQKSLPANKDALFDIGASGPIIGFIIATVVLIIGLPLSVPSPPVEGIPVGMPVLSLLIEWLLSNLKLMPQVLEGQVLLLHPVAFAGLVGVFVTMLNLLPVAQLDGGHVVRSTSGEKVRIVLSILSIIFLFYEGAYLMAFLVLFMSFYRHPGPLDDVSSLSGRRKLLAAVLVVVFVLCTFPFEPFL